MKQFKLLKATDARSVILLNTIFEAVDKTWNMEHPGTSNNYDNYEKKMCKLKFWACSRDHLKRSEWSRRSGNMSLFASRTTLLRNESYGRTFHRRKSIEKVYEVTDY